MKYGPHLGQSKDTTRVSVGDNSEFAVQIGHDAAIDYFLVKTPSQNVVAMALLSRSTFLARLTESENVTIVVNRPRTEPGEKALTQ